MTPKQTAIKASIEATKILKKHFGKTLEENFKAKKEIVTVADLESEKKIISIIKKQFPTHSIYSEEKGLEDNKSDYQWIIDPLDGTGNFARGLPLYGIILCLLYKKEPILGVINIPKLNILAHAEKNKGAFVNNKKIKVSKRNFNKTFFYLPTPWKKRETVVKLINNICPKVQMTRSIDCSAFALLQTATGQAEGFAIYESILHDVAAGILLIKEAGGKVTNWEGKPWTINSKNILVTNGVIHNKIIKLLK
jgi:myo-inositol-1(or 4)-monophosphatase